MAQPIRRRLITRLNVTSLTIASLALVLAACGSGATATPTPGGATPTAAVVVSPAPSPSPLTMTDYVTAVNNACVNVVGHGGYVPGVSPTPPTNGGTLANPTQDQLKAIATYLDPSGGVVASLYAGLYQDFLDLGPPPSLPLVWAHVLAAYSTIVADFAQMLTAATAGDLAAYNAAMTSETADNALANQDFTQFGATVCVVNYAQVNI